MFTELNYFNRMQITFLGTGSSHGIPVLGCECEVCLSPNPKNQRNRTGVWVKGSDGRSGIIDISSEFRISALKYGLKTVDWLLLTHTHSDHISGLDDLRIFSQRHGKATPIYADRRSIEDVKYRFAYAFNSTKNYGGGVPQFEMHEIGNEFSNELTNHFSLGTTKIVPLPILHGPEPIFGFRLNDFAFITDVTIIPDSTLELMQGLEALALDCLRPEPHSTHLGLNQAIAYAEKIKAKRTYFIHMTHELEHEATEKILPEGMFMAYDGLELHLR